jgi:hypothetical protein
MAGNGVVLNGSVFYFGLCPYTFGVQLFTLIIIYYLPMPPFRKFTYKNLCMKKLLIGLGLFVAVSSFAQDKYSPVIKQGTKLNYSAMVNGQNFPCVFSMDSVAAGYVKVGWSVEGFGSGSWVMKSKSLESGNRGFWSQPSPGTQEDLADDQVVMLFSKAQWDMLQKDNKITFDQQTYTVKTPTEQQELKISGKPVDAYYLESSNGSTHIWILNNAATPLLLKIEGNTLGADLTLNSVE